MTLPNNATRFIEKRRAALRAEEDASADGGFIRERATLIDVLVRSEELSDDDVLDEVKAFLGAAVDTTVASLGWTLKVLSLRQDVQDRVLREVHDVLGEDTTVDTHHLSRLEYMERVIKETSRLLPTAPFIGRSTSDVIELSGYTIPRGSTFVVNIYGAHRDPRHWPDPLRFDPDRFLGSESRHPYAFMPFSAGPRNCIGGRQAMMVMKTFLATLLPKYRVDPANDGLSDPAHFPYVFDVMSRMPGGIKVVFTPCQDTPTPK